MPRPCVPTSTTGCATLQPRERELRNPVATGNPFRKLYLSHTSAHLSLPFNRHPHNKCSPFSREFWFAYNIHAFSIMLCETSPAAPRLAWKLIPNTSCHVQSPDKFTTGQVLLAADQNILQTTLNEHVMLPPNILSDSANCAFTKKDSTFSWVGQP